ncbi:hypothetical protein HU200_053824 [Digitaria exilis]|uniref:Peptidase C1A papain C-terminal domain-containing protein n=1 Tax=Digitaria exilis TaxID=1010633 RepID=A0A835ARF5_9POAL|nr:hypothetical protein HU200_053824 [Digitaria exilis]
MEGIVKISTGKLISLSEQELVDCDVHGEDQGCNGDEMDGAFKFIIKNGGLTTESSYPYNAQDGQCNAGSKSVATIKGYEDVPANDEASLMKAVANQHVSVAVDGGDMTFQLYSGGVMTGSCGTDLDHAIAAIGYGTASDGTKYWLMKNSWDTTWGENQPGFSKTGRNDPLRNDRMAEKTLTSPVPLLPSRPRVAPLPCAARRYSLRAAPLHVLHSSPFPPHLSPSPLLPSRRTSLLAPPPPPSVSFVHHHAACPLRHRCLASSSCRLGRPVRRWLSARRACDATTRCYRLRRR